MCCCGNVDFHGDCQVCNLYSHGLLPVLLWSLLVFVATVASGVVPLKFVLRRLSLALLSTTVAGVIVLRLQYPR